ncbi:nucleotide exchange factor GrpE [Patescibacteria group bacterium]|nr:nucleotide exchange factor GrpE [Patescibacteria group bacterium]
MIEKKLNIEELKKQLEECQKKKDEYLAGWQRERADFLNYKKEEIERIGEILKYAGEGLILKILPILDNFEIAEKKILEDLKGEENKSSSSPFAGARENDENVKGLLQIKTQFQDFLKNLGVEEIKSVGDKFDPNFQEVIEEVEAKDKESGIIIEEIQKGYKLHGKVLRPAKVKIAK